MSELGNVTAVKKHPKNDQWRNVVTEHESFICFSAAAADVLEVGKPLPEGTTFEDPKFDGALRSVRLPRGKNAPQVAYRNTKEGQEYEQAAIDRRSIENQERTDRRTALMQAVAWLQSPGLPDGIELTEAADKLYGWLRWSVDGSTAALEGHPLPAAQTATLDRGPSQVGAEVSTGDQGHGEGTEASEGTSAPTYIDGDTIAALIKAFPSKAAATKEAHKRFGVLSLAYLTQTQADELYDAEVTL